MLAQAVPRGTRAGEPLHWPPLPGTRTEMAHDRRLDSSSNFPTAKLKKLRQAKATKGAIVSQIGKFRYFHFATHGFFAPEEFKSAMAASSRRRSPALADAFGRKRLSGFHPGLLSGLVLAGANHAGGGRKRRRHSHRSGSRRIEFEPRRTGHALRLPNRLGRNGRRRRICWACNGRFRSRGPKAWWPRSGRSATTPAAR